MTNDDMDRSSRSENERDDVVDNRLSRRFRFSLVERHFFNVRRKEEDPLQTMAAICLIDEYL